MLVFCKPYSSRRTFKVWPYTLTNSVNIELYPFKEASSVLYYNCFVRVSVRMCIIPQDKFGQIIWLSIELIVNIKKLLHR